MKYGYILMNEFNYRVFCVTPYSEQMKKLNKFLLIDDSRATNFFNKTIIEKVDCVEEVVVLENGKEALDYIKSGVVPEIIFLDINMPIMNGWEFISEYQKLEDKYKDSIIILMLGVELNKQEMELAESFPEIKGFQEKMLTKEAVCKLITKYFEGVNSTVCIEHCN